MDSRLVNTGLVSFLLIAAALVGLTFGGGSSFQNPAGGNASPSSHSQNKPGTFPELVVAVYSYPVTSGLYTYSSLNGTTLISTYGPVVIPTPRPVSGIEIDLIQLNGEQIIQTKVGHPLVYYLHTNSSGMAVINLMAGNYSLTALAPFSNYTTTVSMRMSTTTTLDVYFSPALANVEALVVANQDRDLGVEPTATIFAQVEGTLNDTGSQYFILGAQQGSVFPTELAVNVLGTYPAAQGTWVTMSPSAPYTSVPSDGIALMHYNANSTVRFAPE
ncbi:MAG: hypothetical protein JRN08_07360 [Nitrososphaerota archaeon]|nr:hypothetical protein [Nitrososphaerota archaeon]